MKAPEHETITFGKDGSYKIIKKNFWLVSTHCDAYGNKICEGDRVFVRDENFTYTALFDGTTFVLADKLSEPNGFLVDFDSYDIEVVGHITEEEK